MVSARTSKKSSEAEGGRIHDYELVLILSPELTDESLNSAVEKTSQFITEKGGTVAEVQRWGKRKLAYALKHHLEGNYILVRFKISPTLSKELESRLRISEEVLRHLLVRLDS